jgi:type IV pilus assembly protein PilN
MIRVNLIGRTGKQATGSGGSRKSGPPSDRLPLLWGLILVGALVGGFLWWSGLRTERTRLEVEISTAEARRAELQAVIDQDAIYEERKATLENRIAVIEQLQQNRVSPVVSLDMLSRAVEETEYVWVTNLTQTNTALNVNGTGSSVQAIESFLANLRATGYFRNINLVRAQEANPNYTFQLTMAFDPPVLAGALALGATSLDSTPAGAAGPE